MTPKKCIICDKDECDCSDIGSNFYFAYNLPLQLWRESKGIQVLNYMPRKETCKYLSDRVPQELSEKFCERTAEIFENFAKLIRAFGKGQINHVYYPDSNLEEQIKENQKDREETLF